MSDSESEKVNQYFEMLTNPLKEEMQAVRNIILSCDSRISEDIKWNAPSFAYKGNMATFNPRSKSHVNLVFHKGVIIHDETGLLEGDAKEARVARFHSMEEVHARQEDLQAVVQRWITVMDEVS